MTDSQFVDYYAILDVTPGATYQDIKIAYRNLVRLHHPDLNPNSEDSEAITKLLNEAYGVLSSPEKRQAYDAEYKLYQKQAESAESRRKIKTFELLLRLSLKQIYYGTQETIHVDGQYIDVTIPPGVEFGERLVVQLDNLRIFLTIEITEENKIIRRGLDLYVDYPISLYTAVLGGTLLVRFFDEELELVIPAGTSSDQPLRLKGRGLPAFGNANQRGDVYIRLQIQVPHTLTAEEKSLFQRLEYLSRYK